MYNIISTTYSEAGNCAKVYSNDMLGNCETILSLSKKDIVKRTLRAGYTHNLPAHSLRSMYEQKAPRDLSIMRGEVRSESVDLLQSGQLQPDDTTVAVDEADEDEIYEMILATDWKGIASLVADDEPAALQRRVQRLPAFRWTDRVKDMMPIGILSCCQTFWKASGKTAYVEQIECANRQTLNAIRSAASVSSRGVLRWRLRPDARVIVQGASCHDD